jgi:hypothetical protein
MSLDNYKRHMYHTKYMVYMILYSINIDIIFLFIHKQSITYPTQECPSWIHHSPLLGCHPLVFVVFHVPLQVDNPHRHPTVIKNLLL